MQVVVDTNVLISAIIFRGKPELILEAWRTGNSTCLSQRKFSLNMLMFCIGFQKNIQELILRRLSLLLLKCGILVESQILNKIICEDPDDDKFIAAALGSSSSIIITGDKHLLDVSGYSGIEMIKPAVFVKKYLSEPSH